MTVREDRAPTTELLDSQVCFALYSASRAVTAAYREVLDPLGLTYPQYLVMLVLWENEQITVRDLGNQLRLDSGTLSPMLKRLEHRGFVVRERSVLDERVVLVSLTSDGKNLKAAFPDIQEHICSAVTLSDEERATLRSLASKISAMCPSQNG
ncbi:MarR family winged helix-turn-helix transcriptional regulator [Changpingibacter yushuensis]|uniref:MarR family winged helix-turn-helix transcriptional regulator n=1 Tax=Changpingibacter yushuensis TaxID=2758440 RepID=UPI0024833E67|nr:MarR family transcriptional regulator [Changpingibacter yushuensis]